MQDLATTGSNVVALAPVALVNAVTPGVVTAAKELAVGDSKPKSEKLVVTKSAPATPSATAESSAAGTAPVVVPTAAPMAFAGSARSVETQAVPATSVSSHATTPVSVPTQKTSVAAPMQNESVSNAPTITTMESAKPNQLEVGIRSTEYGWVKVRAEVNADGNVSAVLRASAPAATQLHAQSSALQLYLGEQSVNVHRLQIESAQSSVWHAASSAASENNARNHSAEGQTSQQENSKPTVFDHTTASATESSADDVPSTWLVGQLASSSGTGGWLSVRA